MLVWIALVLLPVSSAILRQEKINNGIFMPDKGMVLADHVISTHHVTSPIDCSFHCTSTQRCLSYNYKPTGPGDQDICQLNNATRKTAQASYKVGLDFVHYFDQSETFKSCLGYLRNGATKNGIYTITDTSGNSFPVYCDLTTEPRSAWTLIQSVALKNIQKYKTAFYTGSFASDLPVDENNPNWEAYRLSLSRMRHLSTVSTHVRATTGFDEYGVDFRDYLRMKTSSLDILSSSTIRASCKMVEFISIRDFAAENINVPFWQIIAANSLHIDSSADRCGDFKASAGSVSSEDNFGLYGSVNPKFRGSKSEESTTQWWYGGYL